MGSMTQGLWPLFSPMMNRQMSSRPMVPRRGSASTRSVAICLRPARPSTTPSRRYASPSSTYEFVPCHYLVADRVGRAFVWEHSAAHNRESIVWADGPQVVTNHLLHRYATLGDLPSEPGNGATYDRARRLAAAIDQPGPLDPEQLKDLHARVRIDVPGEPVRTLWHAVYDPATLAMNISFHLADGATGERRSPCQAFRLGSQRAPSSSNVPETPSTERKTDRGAVV
jgi:hypothetical protein